MVIQASLISPDNSVTEAESFLKTAQYLTEQECDYRPEMVPVIENKRLSANLLKLEDLTEYAVSNGITDAGYAINSICEASDIDMNSVVYTVNEESLLADQDMVDTVKAFLSEGAQVLVVPFYKKN